MFVAFVACIRVVVGGAASIFNEAIDAMTRRDVAEPFEQGLVLRIRSHRHFANGSSTMTSECGGRLTVPSSKTNSVALGTTRRGCSMSL